MIFKHINFFLVLFFLIGCNNNSKQILVDMDNIGQFKHFKYEYESSLTTNYFIFYNDGRLYVPPMAFYSDRTAASWRIIKKNGKIDSLIIEADNKVYQGKFKVDFLKNNTNSRLFMKLKSDSLEIVLYNYFKTKKERDAYINKYGIETTQVSDDYFPQLKQFPDNWKTFD